MSDVHDDEIEASRAPLMSHLVELRQRLIISIVALGAGFGVCFFYSKDIYLFLLQPYGMAERLLAMQKATGAHGPFDLPLTLIGVKAAPPLTAHLNLVFTAPLEFFFTKVQMAGFGGLVVAFPVIAWQLYRFVSPGLYKRERYAFLPFLVASPVLFLMGSALVYYIMLPFVLWFSLSQTIDSGNISVQALTKVSDYLTLITTLLLAFGLCFQLPVILSLLGMAELVTSKVLAGGRRYAVVAVFGVAAVVAPPDPFSMIALAVPVCLLYEVSIWCVRLIELRRKKDETEETA